MGRTLFSVGCYPIDCFTWKYLLHVLFHSQAAALNILILNDVFLNSLDCCTRFFPFRADTSKSKMVTVRDGSLTVFWVAALYLEIVMFIRSLFMCICLQVVIFKVDPDV